MSGHDAAPDHRTERLSFFSDAVFAIAITLLVIEIRPPHPEASGAAHLQALINLWPSFFAYALSFLVIARFWMGHHSAMALVGGFSPRLLWPNSLLLMAIAFMPFSTAYLATNASANPPYIFYNTMLLVTALANRAVVVLATTPGIRAAGVDVATVRLLRVRAAAVVGGAFTATLGALCWPWIWGSSGWAAMPGLAELLLLTIPIWLRLLLWLDRRHTRAEAARMHELVSSNSEANA